MVVVCIYCVCTYGRMQCLQLNITHFNIIYIIFNYNLQYFQIKMNNSVQLVLVDLVEAGTCITNWNTVYTTSYRLTTRGFTRC